MTDRRKYRGLVGRSLLDRVYREIKEIKELKEKSLNSLNSLISLISLKNNKGDCHEPFGSRNDDT